MSAAEQIRLEGKDWFRELEAAEYCGMCRRSFQDWAKQAGIIPRRVGAGGRARKLYSRADLYAAIAACPEWQSSTSAAAPGTSLGQRTGSTGGGLSDRLKGERLREYVPRRKPS